MKIKSLIMLLITMLIICTTNLVVNASNLKTFYLLENEQYMGTYSISDANNEINIILDDLDTSKNYLIIYAEYDEEHNLINAYKFDNDNSVPINSNIHELFFLNIETLLSPTQIYNAHKVNTNNGSLLCTSAKNSLLNMIDNKTATYWHSDYDVVDGKATNPDSPPYVIKYKLNNKIYITNITLIFRTDSAMGYFTSGEIIGLLDKKPVYSKTFTNSNSVQYSCDISKLQVDEIIILANKTATDYGVANRYGCLAELQFTIVN